ncbi:nicotinate-nucleotide--dimethylbenzimidazole phosphoribosyltransferase [Streptomyces sp. NPDC051018]|uniref:nicotinate-nucleotide--dimethylbenzimidazole phosphoribosyltransferase n=1 Tax=Streptomyces sp. NPDC051018 TaxID=3365639 RepID=UPI003795BBA9
MTDTGQIPGEGLPENAGVVEQQPGDAPGSDAYTFLGPSEHPAEEDDLLLMPGAQGAWSDPQAAASPPPQQAVAAQPLHAGQHHGRPGQQGGAVRTRTAVVPEHLAVVGAQPGAAAAQPGHPAAQPAAPFVPAQHPDAQQTQQAQVPQQQAEVSELLQVRLPSGPELTAPTDLGSPDLGDAQDAVAGPEHGGQELVGATDVVVAPELAAPTDLGAPDHGTPEHATPVTVIQPAAEPVAGPHTGEQPDGQGAEAPAPEHGAGGPLPGQPDAGQPVTELAVAEPSAEGQQNGGDAAAGQPGAGVPRTAQEFPAAPAAEQPAPAQGSAPAVASTATPTPPPSRRPLHMGPPLPDTSGGVVRSLADRGPAGVPPHPLTVQNNPGPPTMGPEYLDVPQEETEPVPPGPQPAQIPPQAGAPWGAQPPEAGASAPAEAGVVEAAVAEAVVTEAVAAVPTAPAAPAAGEAAEGQPVVESVAEPLPAAGPAAVAAPEPVPGGDPVQNAAATGEPAQEGTPEEAPDAVGPAAPGEAPVPGPEVTAQDGPEVELQGGPEAQVEEEPEARAAGQQQAEEPAGPQAETSATGGAEGAAPVEPAGTGSVPETEQVQAAVAVEQETNGAEAAVVPDAGAAVPEPAAAPAPAGDSVPQTGEPAEAVVPAAGAVSAQPMQAAETTEITETTETTQATEAAAPAEAEAAADPGQSAEGAGAAEGAAEPAEAAEKAEPIPLPVPAPEPAPEPGSEPEPIAAEAGPPAPGFDDAEREAVLRVMRERRDIRNGFRDDPIPHEVLLRVLEAAHTAPSVGHSQPWDFVVIRSAETRRTMHELAQRQRDAYAKSLPKGRAKQFKELKIEAILETPVNIVVTADPTRGGRHTLGRHTQPQMAPYSSALAVENLWLAARAEGLGVGWVSFFDEHEMVRALGLPEHLEVVAYLCVGYVDEFPEDPELMQSGWSKRRPLSWVVHEETYGRRALPGEEPHDLLQETVTNIRPLDAKALGEAWERQKRMTKPAGALGMLEIISAQLSGLSRMCPPPIPEPAAVAVFAGDHGVHAQGVTAWPQEVTGQMVANFLGGGAVCNAFANQVGAEVCVIDVGVASDLPATPGLLPRKVRPGTADFTAGPALTREEALSAIDVGIETARDLVAAGNKALLTGEMGIANTTVSAALISVYTGTDPAEVTGRGTGINDEMHARKVDVVRRALELHKPDPADPVGVLAAVGGLEHAALVGFILGGASLRTPVVLDGVSAGAAALVARAIAPEALAACIAGHRSAEPGHVAALNKLGLRPLVDLDLRLGEGTGALLALPVVQSAARAMHEVATFDSAGVTEK